MGKIEKCSLCGEVKSIAWDGTYARVDARGGVTSEPWQVQRCPHCDAICAVSGLRCIRCNNARQTRT